MVLYGSCRLYPRPSRSWQFLAVVNNLFPFYQQYVQYALCQQSLRCNHGALTQKESESTGRRSTCLPNHDQLVFIFRWKGASWISETIERGSAGLHRPSHMNIMERIHNDIAICDLSLCSLADLENNIFEIRVPNFDIKLSYPPKIIEPPVRVA